MRKSMHLHSRACASRRHPGTSGRCQLRPSPDHLGLDGGLQLVACSLPDQHPVSSAQGQKGPRRPPGPAGEGSLQSQMAPPGGQTTPRGALQQGVPPGQQVQAGLGALGAGRPPQQLQMGQGQRQ